MRLVLSALVVACGSPAKPEVVVPPISNTARSCTEAAVGLERGTRSIRDPDSSVLETMRSRCTLDSWPTAAIDCFATMREGELGQCAAKLHDEPREAMFAVLGGGSDRAAIAIARLRLQSLVVGVAECDQFVTAVTTALGCEGMPVDARVMLGNETASFWDLPTHGLPPDAQRRMAEVCGASLAELQQQTAGLGCGP